MTIVTRGYGGRAIATWGYGDLIFVEITQTWSELSSSFEKLDAVGIAFDMLNDLNVYMELLESDIPVEPPIDDELYITSEYLYTVKLGVIMESINTMDSFMQRVIIQEPIGAVINPPTDGLFLETQEITGEFEYFNNIEAEYDIADELATSFERVIPEEN